MDRPKRKKLPIEHKPTFRKHPTGFQKHPTKQRKDGDESAS